MANACRALVVSLNPRTWQRMSAVLDAWGVDVICCSTAAEAREALEREPFPMVFCEDWLRDGTYHEVLDAAKASVPDVHFVVVSGPAVEHDRGFKAEALEQGAYAVLGASADSVDIEWLAARAIHEAARVRAGVEV